MREAEARAHNGITTQVLTHTSYDSQSENAGLQKENYIEYTVMYLGIWCKNKKRIKLECRKSEIIFHPGDVFQNGVFRGWMEGFLGRAQDSELKIRVPGESRMLVAELWPKWW